jgi:probable phosphomutase (TIGR03848 family)
MATFLLIRHGAHLLGGETIAGRMEGVHLSPLGKSQAAGLIGRVGGLPIRAVYTSPVARCRETAAPLAAHLGLAPQAAEGLSEIDFGEWTGRTLADLRPLPEWKRWNAFRSGARAPGGESMVEVQSRIVLEMERLAAAHEGECIALFSHGDVIKAAVAHWLGVPLDLFVRIEISLASVSVVRLAEFGPWILGVNNAGDVVLG